MWFNESTYPELLLVRQTKSKAKTKAMGPEDKDIKFSLEAKAWPQGLHHW